MQEWETIPVHKGTKERIDNEKPDGVTYDYWVRQLMGDNDQ